MSRFPKFPVTVAVVSFLFTALFFLEYLPPLRRVSIPYDLNGYHYPLNDYAFQALKQHRIPEWDATMYCGMSFVGNPQTATFYPPMWLAFAADRHKPWLRYSTLEIVALAHVWLAFLLCYLWLRGRGLTDLSSILGGAVFAYGGFMLLQLQHFGQMCGYAWFPLGLWGIDQAIMQKHWRPLWKLAVASAMIFLAGYPPIWFVYAVIVTVYCALRRKAVKTVALAWTALVFSLLLAMIQLLPSLQMTADRSMGPHYGSGSMPRLELWISYILPNYFDFALTTPIQTNPGAEYLYLGVPALFGLVLLCLSPKRLVQELPLIGVVVACVILVVNPFNAVWTLLKYSELLSQICRAWYFLAGITLGAAGLAAAGIDSFLRRSARPLPAWLGPVAITIALAWAARQIYVWMPGSPEFAPGWVGAVDVAVTIAIFSLLLFLIRASGGRKRQVLTAALLLLIGADYKAFGTSKRVNADLSNPDALRKQALFRGMADDTFRQLEENRDYRIALSDTAPQPEALRHPGLTTPQGRDPLISGQIRKILGDLDFTGFGKISPNSHDQLRRLAVRYYITSEADPEYQMLLADSRFRMLPSQDYYYRVFELQDALPVYRWADARPGDRIRRLDWTPEVRSFEVNSAGGGKFVLVEQLAPGWTATVDGHAVPIERWDGAFQAIPVPAGTHEVIFRFRSRPVRWGALISSMSLAVLVLMMLPSGTLLRGAGAVSRMQVTYPGAAIAILAVFFLVNVYRAATQAISTDEAWAYLKVMDGPLSQLFSVYDACHHVLYTYLAALSVWIFKLSPFSLRIPSLLAGALYFSVAYRLCLWLIGPRVRFLLALGLLCLNPMMLDFFVAARGYGLAAACLLLAIYELLRFCGEDLKQSGTGRLILSGLALSASVAANLTFLFPALAVVAIAITLIVRFRHDRWMSLQRYFAAVIIPALLLMAAPLSHATKEHFYFGATTLTSSLNGLAEGSIYDTLPDFLPPTWNDTYLKIVLALIQWLPAIGVLLLIPLGAVIARAARGLSVLDRTSWALLISGVTAWTTLAGVIVAHLFFQTPYPRLRTGLYLLPLFSLHWIAAAEWCFARRSAWRWGGRAMTSAAAISVAFFLLCFRPTYFGEWAYCGRIQAMLVTVERYRPKDRSVTISSDIEFEPVLNFYRKRRLDWMAPVTRQANDAPADFYFLMGQSRNLIARKNLRVLYSDPRSKAVVAVEPSR